MTGDVMVGAGEIDKLQSPHVVRERLFPHYALVLMTGGGGFYGDAGGERDVAAGDVISVFPGLRHGYGPRPGQPWREIWLSFQGPLFVALERDGLLDRRRPLLRGVADAAIDAAFRSLLRDHARPAGARPALFVARLHALIAELDHRARRLADAGRPPWIAEACARLEERLDKPLDLAALARALGLGYGAFRKGFARAIGMPPARYRVRRRVDRAMTLLAEPDATLASVAERLGYCDVYFFARQFRQVAGRTPGAWRRLHGG